jgi:hypothetical protein
MIDASKIKVGDEVTVRGRVYHVSARYKKCGIGVSFQDEDRDARGLIVSAKAIATHTPAPREFKPGDRVILSGNDTLRWRVIAIDAGYAWLKWDGFAAESGPEPHSAYFGKRATLPIQHLRHAD